MHYNKPIIIFFTALTASFSMSCLTCDKAIAVEAPTDIHLTVETKEIAIDEVPDDRIVTLSIYQENCPCFDTMSFFVTKDPRLSYYPDDDCFGIPDGVRNVQSFSTGYYDRSSDDRICDLISYIGDEYLIEFDDALATVTFKLPEQLSPGDFFSVELPRYLKDTPLQIALGADREYSFSDSCFTQLNNGGIRIVNKEQPAPSGGNDGGGNGGSGNGSGGGHGSGVQDNAGVWNTGGDTQDKQNTAVQEITAAVTSVTAAETSVTLKTVSVSTTTAKATTKSVPMISTESTTKGTTTDATTTTTTALQESGRKKANGLIIIGIFTLIAAAVSSLMLLASKLKIIKKRNK